MNWFNLYAKIYDPFMKLFGLYKVDVIIDCLNPKKNEKILDLAGGTGYIASKILPKAKEVVVLDDSKNMLKQASKYEGLKLCHAKAQKIPFPDAHFDSVICIDSFHHIKDIDPTIKEIRRVLKDNGKLVVYEFDIKGIKGWILWLFEKIYIDNSRFIKPDELSRKLEEQGFKGTTKHVSGIEYIYTGNRR